MFIALSLGIPTICFFHILIHALAKANLFIVIGRLLHRRFRQQDSRIIRSRTLGSLITLRIRVRLFRLVGLTFISGFYSKEQVLTGHSFVLNSISSNFIILVVISLTLAYCLKLFIRVFSLNPERVLISSIYRITQFFPIFIMRAITVFIGFIFRLNVAPCSLIIERLERIY
jgi:NADH:ubiquinone oxidoreductase subunit 5 (subunit L)/multisubunit Na+/H+ antiporter MnhA subunit